MAGRKAFLLRLDPAVFDALQRWAADDLRSTNGQVEFLLRRALRDAGRLPFELRFYTVDQARVGVGNFKGGINELHKRFREGEVEVFKRNGVDVMAVWQSLDNPDTLVYLLSYKDRAAREAGWAAFNADPEWTELRNKYFVPLQSQITFMSATDYSPLK